MRRPPIPPLCGGAFQALPNFQTSLGDHPHPASRPMTFGHFTSWNADDRGYYTSAWIHSLVVVTFSEHTFQHQDLYLQRVVSQGPYLLKKWYVHQSSKHTCEEKVPIWVSKTPLASPQKPPRDAKETQRSPKSSPWPPCPHQCPKTIGGLFIFRHEHWKLTHPTVL